MRLKRVLIGAGIGLLVLPAWAVAGATIDALTGLGTDMSMRLAGLLGALAIAGAVIADITRPW